jgi:hypothetical protein
MTPEEVLRRNYIYALANQMDDYEQYYGTDNPVDHNHILCLELKRGRLVLKHVTGGFAAQSDDILMEKHV